MISRTSGKVGLRNTDSPPSSVVRLRPLKKVVDWTEAERLYRDESLSFAQIAKRMGYSEQGVRRALKTRGVVPRRLKAPNDRASIALKNLWLSIRRRCESPASPNFKRHGGRGITMCDAWRDDFAAFGEWALKGGFRSGMAIVRRRADGDFEPANCRVVSKGLAANVRRSESGRDEPRRTPPASKPPKRARVELDLKRLRRL